jgi:Tfp pilus assembly protein PilO
MALAILLVALTSVYLLVIAPAIGLYSQGEAILADRSMLAPRLSVAAAALPALRSEVTKLRAAVSASRITLNGTSDAIASANLQSQIEKLATAGGVAIGRTEAITAENRGSYRKVGLRIAVSGDYEALIKLLAAIETGVPPLVLANLQIRPAASGNARMEVSFEVYGYRGIDDSLSLKQ